MYSSKQFVLAVTIFLPWLLAMATVQVATMARSVSKRPWPWLLFWKRWDRLSLCPTFTFFSWLPSAHYHLFIRDLYPGDQWSPWRLVRLPRRSRLRLFWNPARRARFALEDACRAMLAHLGQAVSQNQAVSQTHTISQPNPVSHFDNISLDFFAYRYLAHFTITQPASPLTLQRQFMMAQVKTLAPEQPPAPLFLSPFLPLDPCTSTLRPEQQATGAGFTPDRAGKTDKTNKTSKTNHAA